MALPTDSDPLERVRHRRMIVMVTAGVAVVVFVASVTGDVPGRLPGVALESPLLLHVERSLVVAGAVAGTLIFLVRGWGGYFPSKLSASGAEYAERSAVAEGVRNEDDIYEALSQMETKRVALAKSLHEDLRALEQRMNRESQAERYD